MQKTKITLAGLLAITLQISVQAMDAPGPITSAPQEIIRHIAGFLGKQRDINALAGTCHYLYASATGSKKSS